MAPLEIEVKFHLTDPDGIRRRIRSLDAAFGGVSDELNLRFEDAADSLVKKKMLLRLRKADGITLTCKSPAQRADTQFKVHQELEVTVSDFGTMQAILETLGYHIAQRYEKRRETYTIGDTVLCLDTMPYGDFLEIEGEPDAIRKIAGQLGLDWSKRILSNYLAIFEDLRRQLGLSFTDVTFENFKDIPVDFTAFAHLFTAPPET